MEVATIGIIILVLYLLIVNAIAFILMYSDKQKAIKNQWRIKESVLFLSAIFGGSLGSILGMQTFRHKTKHMKFVIGIPAILVIQIIIAIVILSKLI